MIENTIKKEYNFLTEDIGSELLGMLKRGILYGVCLFLLVFCFCACGIEAPEPTAETTTVLRDPNGDVIPTYSDVDRATLEPGLFQLNDNGRMFYNDPDIKTYSGIDISVFQGDVDWESVKNDGIDFVMLRVGFRGYSQGSLNEDANFKKNCENALAAGLKVGVYFFSQAITPEEAQAEAEYVLSLIGDFDITYPVAYDWESIDYDTARTDGLDNETITQCAVRFCDTVAASGYQPVIYFNRSLGYFSYDLSLIKDYHFWLAEYDAAPSFIYDYKIWQYSKTGTVDGIEGNVDLNISIQDYSVKESVG